MDRRAVEAFREVLRKQLPVRLHVGNDALADPEVSEAIPFVLLGCFKWSIPFETNEDKSSPGLHRDLVKWEPRHVEVGRLHPPRRRDQLAGEIVGPGVVRTDDALAGEVALLFVA